MLSSPCHLLDLSTDATHRLDLRVHVFVHLPGRDIERLRGADAVGRWVAEWQGSKEDVSLSQSSLCVCVPRVLKT